MILHFTIRYNLRLAIPYLFFFIFSFSVILFCKIYTVYVHMYYNFPITLFYLYCFTLFILLSLRFYSNYHTSITHRTPTTYFTHESLLTPSTAHHAPHTVIDYKKVTTTSTKPNFRTPPSKHDLCTQPSPPEVRTPPSTQPTWIVARTNEFMRKKHTTKRKRSSQFVKPKPKRSSQFVKPKPKKFVLNSPGKTLIRRPRSFIPSISNFRICKQKSTTILDIKSQKRLLRQFD